MAKRLGLIGGVLLNFAGITLLLVSILFIFNKEINSYIFIISLILSMISLFAMTEKDTRYSINSILNMIVCLMIIFGAIKLSEHYYDFSYDGQAYQQEALIQLNNGWNPVYETVNTGNTKDLWINHYAKAIWYMGSTIYEFTGNIESAKAFNFIILISTLFLLIEFINRFLNSWIKTLIISFVLVFSPVVINQIFTNYNDFFIILMILNILVGYLAYFEQHNKKALLTIFTSLLILINIKFTALGYAVVLTGIPILIIIYKVYILKQKIQYKKLVLVIIASFVIGLGIVGNATYVKNTLSNGHPFYPLAGDGKVDIITNNTPAGVAELNRLEKFYISIFSKTTNSFVEEPKTKFPLSVSKEEISHSKATDTRIGGFGPLFGFILILTLILVVYHFNKIRRSEIPFLLIVFGVIIISIFINPETWWARYIPQAWILPILASIVIFKNNIKSYLVGVILLVYIINIVIVGNASLTNMHKNQIAQDKELEELLELNKEHTLMVDFGAYSANRIRLEERGIEYQIINSVDGCGNIMQLTSSTTKICIINN